MTQITSFSEPRSAPVTLPDGRAVDRVPQGELYTALSRLGIVGFDHRNGRATNVALYESHLRHVAAVAGREAVERWLNEHR